MAMRQVFKIRVLDKTKTPVTLDTKVAAAYLSPRACTPEAVAADAGVYVYRCTYMDCQADSSIPSDAQPFYGESVPNVQSDGTYQLAGGAAPVTVKDGLDGKSAYQLAQQAGYAGTLAQWLAALVGAAGKDGIVPIYGAGGLLANVKAWIGRVTTDANGNWTADLSKAGFTAVPVMFSAQAISASVNAADRASANVVTTTAAAMTGSVTIPVTLLALGLTERKAGAGVVVSVLAIGV